VVMGGFLLGLMGTTFSEEGKRGPLPPKVKKVVPAKELSAKKDTALKPPKNKKPKYQEIP